MKNKLFSGIFFIIFGLLIAFGPQFIFPVCAAMGDGYMKCHWTAQAELGVGILIAISGLLYLLQTSVQVRIGLQLAIILQFVLSILIPNILIGVCAGNHMTCHAATLPFLNILGVIGVIVGVANTVYLYKNEIGIKIFSKFKTARKESDVSEN